MIGGSYGLSWKEGGTRVAAPPRLIKVETKILDLLADITAELTYSNIDTEHTETVFSFPVDSSQTTVYKLQVEVDGILLASRYVDEKQAHDDVDALKDGPSAVFEEEPEPHTFKCAIGSLALDSDVKVTIAYIHRMKLSVDGYVKLLLPTVLNPEEESTTFDFFATVQSGHKINSVTSETNKFHVWLAHNGRAAEVSLSEKHGTTFDLEMCIEYENLEEPSVIIEAGNAEDTDQVRQEPVLMVSLTPALDTSDQGAGGEYIFVVDCSGSMSGSNIQHARETLLLFLKSLPIGCYFNVVCFGSRYDTLFSAGSQVYSQSTLKLATDLQEKMSASMGGTNLYDPLHHILNQPPIIGYTREIFVLTDGFVTNNAQVINLATEHAKSTRISVFGIGGGADKNLVMGLAKAGGGVYDFVESTDRSMESKVMTTLQSIMRASASGFTFDWRLPAGIKAVDCTNDTSPVFSGDERILLYRLCGKISNRQILKASVKLSYNANGENESHIVKFDLGNQVELPSMPLHCLATEADVKWMEAYPSHHGYQAEVARLSALYHIPSKYTSLVCVQSTNGEQMKGVVHVQASPVLPPSPAPVPAPAPVFNFGGGAGFKFGAGRHRKILRDNLSSINAPTIKRISRRAGVTNMSSLVPEEMRGVLKWFLTKIIKSSVEYADHCRRKLIKAEDVDLALQLHGIKMYGTDKAPQMFEDGPYRYPGKRTHRRTTPMSKPSSTPASVGAESRATSLRRTSTTILSRASSNATKENQSLLGRKLSGSVHASLQKNDSRTSLSSRSRQRVGSKTSNAASLRKTPSSASADRPSLGEKTTSAASLRKTTSTTSNVSGQPTLGRRSSSHASESGASTLTRRYTLRRVGTLNTSNTVTPMDTTSTQKSLKRKATDQSPPGGTTGTKMMKRTTVRKTAQKTPLKAHATAHRKISMTRQQRGSIATGVVSKVKDFTTMVTMVTLQTYDGSWDMSKELASLIGQSTETLQKKNPITNLKAWATALGLMWLERHFAESRSEWEMIQYKGIKWLQSQNLQGRTVEDLQRTAAKEV